MGLMINIKIISKLLVSVRELWIKNTQECILLQI